MALILYTFPREKERGGPHEVATLANYLIEIISLELFRNLHNTKLFRSIEVR